MFRVKKPLTSVGLVSKYFKDKVNSIVFIRKNFLIVGESKLYTISIMYNHIRTTKKKKSGSNKLMNLASTRNKFIGENEQKYSISQFNGQQLKGIFGED
jgi:predicted membrane protein